MPEFDADAFQYDYRSKSRDPRVDDRIVAFMPADCERALDAACGSGRLAVRLAGCSRSVCALDLSTTMLTLALKRHGSPSNVGWAQGNLQALPFDANSFDFVASVNALHLVNPDLCLPELKRVLRPGGKLVVCNWTADSSYRAARLQLVRTLRMAYAVFREFGLRNAWKFIVERDRRRREAHDTWYVPLSPAAFGELAERHLPGSGLQRWRKTVLAFWLKS